MFKKKYIKIFLGLIILLQFFPALVFAQPILGDRTVTSIKHQEEALRENAGFQSIHVGNVVSLGIKAFLSILGILFIILVILGGYYWMTAGGDETKMTKAKDTLKKAIIGLIIIISAYAITAFVFKALDDTVGSGGSGMSGSSYTGT